MSKYSQYTIEIKKVIQYNNKQFRNLLNILVFFFTTVTTACQCRLSLWYNLVFKYSFNIIHTSDTKLYKSILINYFLHHNFDLEIYVMS